MKYGASAIIAFTLALMPLTVGAGQIQSVCFTPGQDCQSQIVHHIQGAKKTIRVQAYGFTAAPIADALKEAHRRGVIVQVLLDKSQLGGKGNKAATLHEAGVSVRIDAVHRSAHNKVILVDTDIVITGSYNFTQSAHGSNAENLLVIKDKEVFAGYLVNFEQHLAHSIPYGR